MTDDIIGAAERALQDCASDYDAERLARKVLVAVTPMIRAAALEEAAKVAEEIDVEHASIIAIAAAIRALKEQP